MQGVENIIYANGNLKAGADLSGNQFYLVKLDANGDVVLAAAATDKIHGVLLNKPKSGEAASVGRIGVAKILAGGAIAIGDRITSDAAGKGVAAAPAAGTNNGTVGIALEAGAAGEIVSVELSVTTFQG